MWYNLCMQRERVIRFEGIKNFCNREATFSVARSFCDRVTGIPPAGAYIDSPRTVGAVTDRKSGEYLKR